MLSANDIKDLHYFTSDSDRKLSQTVENFTKEELFSIINSNSKEYLQFEYYMSDEGYFNYVLLKSKKVVGNNLHLLSSACVDKRSSTYGKDSIYRACRAVIGYFSIAVGRLIAKYDLDGFSRFNLSYFDNIEFKDSPYISSEEAKDYLIERLQKELDDQVKDGYLTSSGEGNNKIYYKVTKGLSKITKDESPVIEDLKIKFNEKSEELICIYNGETIRLNISSNLGNRFCPPDYTINPEQPEEYLYETEKIVFEALGGEYPKDEYQDILWPDEVIQEIAANLLTIAEENYDKYSKYWGTYNEITGQWEDDDFESEEY